MADEVLVAQTAGGLSQVERVVDTFTAPQKTFTDVLRSSSWWFPFLISVIFGYVLTFGIQTKVGWPQLVDNQIQASPKLQSQLADAPPERVAMTRKAMTYSFEGTFYAFPIVSIISLLLMAVVLWPTINFAFGGKATYPQVFSVLNYAFLPAVLKSVAVAAMLFFGGAVENFTVDNMLGTNPGYYIDTPGALKVLLTSFDVFTLWTLVLLSLGLATVARVKKGAGFGVVFGWWLLIVLVKTGMAAVSGS